MNWIFAYGSLIWRPDFNYTQSLPARVNGWRRRFWQASPDHRGVPGAPGRVVTLVADADAECAGVAYLPAADEAAEIFSALDVREQNGYDLLSVEMHLSDGRTVAGLTYIAGPSNPSFIGPAPVAEMAEQIANSHGPSGSNREYLLRLQEALKALNICDDEVSSLARALSQHDRGNRTRRDGQA